MRRPSSHLNGSPIDIRFLLFARVALVCHIISVIESRRSHSRVSWHSFKWTSSHLIIIGRSQAAAKFCSYLNSPNQHQGLRPGHQHTSSYNVMWRLMKNVHDLLPALKRRGGRRRFFPWWLADAKGTAIYTDDIGLQKRKNRYISWMTLWWRWASFRFICRPTSFSVFPYIGIRYPKSKSRVRPCIPRTTSIFSSSDPTIIRAASYAYGTRLASPRHTKRVGNTCRMGCSASRRAYSG